MTAPVISRDQIDADDVATAKRPKRSLRIGRRRLRAILLLAGILPAILVFALLLKVAVMLSHDNNGREAFADGNYKQAAQEFAGNLSLNWFEPWVAPFNRGAAKHAAEDYDVAITLYRQALESVPATDACLVRTNLALAYEGSGDKLEEGPPPDIVAAIEEWEKGLKSLVDGDCATDPGSADHDSADADAQGASFVASAADDEKSDAQKVADRLREKIDIDTDEDGISDGDELSGERNDDYGNEPTDPKLSDTDGDGLADGDELDAGTDPNNADTDGGGAPDGAEVGQDNTDPLNPSDDKVQSAKGGQQSGKGKTPKEKKLDKRNQQGQNERKNKQEGDGQKNGGPKNGGPKNGGKQGGQKGGQQGGQQGGKQGGGRPGGGDPGTGEPPEPTW